MQSERKNGERDVSITIYMNYVYHWRIDFVYQKKPADYQEAQVVVNVLSPDFDIKSTTTSKQVYFNFDYCRSTYFRWLQISVFFKPDTFSLGFNFVISLSLKCIMCIINTRVENLPWIWFHWFIRATEVTKLNRQRIVLLLQ